MICIVSVFFLVQTLSKLEDAEFWLTLHALHFGKEGVIHNLLAVNCMADGLQKFVMHKR
jgi:hypothetical protein